MAATGKTPILLYGSTTATNVPVAGNLTNSSDGCEIAINVADKNLFFKDNTNAVNTVPIRQSSGSSDGWLSSANWTTFNSKQAAYTNLTSIGSLANATGWLYNNGSGTFSYSTPSASDVGAVPTSRTVSTTSPLAGGGALSSNLTLSITQATTSTSGYLSSTDWNTFNNKQAALVSGTNIKTVNGTSLLGSGDVGTIGVAYGGTGATTLTSGYFLQGNGTSAVSTSTKLYTDGSNLFSDCYHKVTVQSGATANTAPTGLIVANKTTGTAATGFGSALEFNYQDVSGNYAGGKIASLAGADIFTASLAFYPRNYGYTEAMRIHPSGGVSIGNTTNPGAGNLSVTGKVTAPNLQGPSFSAYQNANQSINNITTTVLNYQIEEFDTGGCFNNTNSTVTLNGISVPAYSFAPNVAGYYQISGGVMMNIGASGSVVESVIFKNGSIYKYGSFGMTDPNGYGVGSGSALVYLNGTSDYVNFAVWHQGGAAKNTNSGAANVWFTGCLVRSA